MINRLDKIINNHSQKIDKWVEILNNHKESLFSDKFSSEVNEKLIYETVEVLAGIINMAIKFGNFKDDFDTSKMHLNLYGPALIIKSTKTNITFYLATDLDGIYLEARIVHSENLKNMDDDFWVELFELKKIKGFEYEENSYFSIDTQRKYPELFHTYKNTMFLMFRKFFLSATENHRDIDLGSFKVKWESNIDFETMIEELCFAFKSIYKLNYKLWKITDLKNKKAV